MANVLHSSSYHLNVFTEKEQSVANSTVLTISTMLKMGKYPSHDFGA